MAHGPAQQAIAAARLSLSAQDPRPLPWPGRGRGRRSGGGHGGTEGVSGAGWLRRGAQHVCEREADLTLRLGVRVGRWRFPAACMAARRRRRAPASM